jgi:hypothetical protein
MNTSELSLVPLKQASLCLDCDMITSSHTNCLACGSAALLNLARTLNAGRAVSPIARKLSVVASNSSRHAREPMAFNSSTAHRPPRLRSQYMNFHKVISALLTGTDRRQASAIR